MTSETILFHDQTGMTSQTARLIVVESGFSCRPVKIDAGLAGDHLAPWFARINPEMTLPVLAIDGLYLSGIRAISRAVLDFPDENLSKDAKWLVAAEEEWDAMLAVSLARPPVRGFVRFNLRRRMRLAEKYARENCDLAAAYETKIDELRRLIDAVGDIEQTQKRLRRLDALFNKFERRVAGREFVFSNQWSYVDAVWTTLIARLRRFGLRDLVNRTRHPATSAYYHRMKSRPSFSAAGVDEKRSFIRLPSLALSPASPAQERRVATAKDFHPSTIDQRSAS